MSNNNLTSVANKWVNQYIKNRGFINRNESRSLLIAIAKYINTIKPPSVGTQTANFTNIDVFLNSIKNRQINNNIKQQLIRFRNTPELNNTRKSRINGILNSTVQTNTNVNILLTRYGKINVSKLKNRNKNAITQKLRTVFNSLHTDNNRRNRIKSLLRRINPSDNNLNSQLDILLRSLNESSFNTFNNNTIISIKKQLLNANKRPGLSQARKNKISNLLTKLNSSAVLSNSLQ